MNFVPLAFYAAALIAYAIHFTRRQPAVGRTATTLLVLAALAHTFVIGMQTMDVGHIPFADASAFTNTFVLLLALSYLYVEMTTDERAMGIFILPMLAALQSIPAIKPGHEERAALLSGPLFNLHVSSLLFAYASFALACVIGITYVLLFKEIKAKHLGFFYTRLPSLQVLDSMNQKAIVVGWVFLTIGIVVGAIWTGAGARHLAGRSARPGDVAAGPEDSGGAGLVGDLFIRGVRGAANRLGRTAHGVSVGARLRPGLAKFRADQLFPDAEP
jgi:ABC-type transport system involved in cytochrome c biogenesis permease subunit